MWPALRQPVSICAALVGLALLTGCESNDGRPPAKPEHLTAKIATQAEGEGSASLKRARVSTKSGEILILEPDGELTEMDLDSAAGQQAFAVTEEQLMALNANLDLDLPNDLVAANLPPRKTAQEKMIEEFAARTQPALPTWKEGTKIEPADFIGVRVTLLNEGKGNDLVSVVANLREGVDADIAFSYATCALARWARTEDRDYGRHIRTLQDTRKGKLLIDSAFTISDKKPLGLRVMETKEALRDCKARGIPAA